MARLSEEFVVVPEGWLSRGEAFVSGDGAQLSVFGGIPGERARVRLLERRQHQSRAKFLKVQGPASPDRVEPPCERYVPCGRCPLMHVSRAGQDRARIDVLRQAFTEAKVAPIAGGRGIDAVVHVEGDALHAMELEAGWSDDRHLRIGVPARDARRLVAIPSCTVSVQSLRTMMTATAHFARALEVWPWEGHRGSLRGFSARQSVTTGEMLVTFVFARSSPFAKELANAVASQQPEVVGAFAHWNDVVGPMVAAPEDGEPEASLVYGRNTIEEDVDGLRVRIGALDPFPTYPRAGVRAWKELVAALAPVQGDAVVDIGAGAGAGARTLLLARAAGWALGIDPRETVIRRARENAAANGIGADFVAGRADYALEDAQPRLMGRRPLAVLEAGPKGLDTLAVNALLAVEPRRIAITSTNPRALGKDIARLTERAFQLTRVIPVDTAPHTPFGETIALLVSSDTTPPTLRAPRRRTVRS